MATLCKTNLLDAFQIGQDYVTNVEGFVGLIIVDHSLIRITEEHFHLHKDKNLSTVSENFLLH